MTSAPGAPSGIGEIGDRSLEEVTAAVYGELRRLAGGYLRRTRNATLQPTALVHEVYLRMKEQEGLRLRNRGHFFGIAARCMRQILVDHARSRQAVKRGGDARRVEDTVMLQIGSEPAAAILELNDALNALARHDARMSRMIELCYFGGLDHAETAGALGVSATTVKRDLRLARAWLLQQLSANRT